MKKISILLLAFALLLSGCQLARTDIESSGDRLIGVYVTTEYLDLFDMEAYLNDNRSKLYRLNGNVIEGDTSDYQGRIYAKLETKTYTAEDGSTSEFKDYQFEGLDGIAFYAARIGDSEAPHIATCSDDALIDGHTALNYTDDSEEIRLEGSILMAHTDGIISCYANPVYQAADGSVYLTASDGGVSTSGDSAVGVLMTKTLEATTTQNDNGRESSYTCSVKVSIGTELVPEQYVLVQMDKHNGILTQDSYKPGQLPEEITPESDTAYFLLETHSRNSDGTPSVTRALYDQTTENFPTRYCRDDGFLAQDYVTINW